MLRRARTGVQVALLGVGTFAATATSPAQADDSGNGNDGQPMGGVVGAAPTTTCSARGSPRLGAGLGTVTNTADLTLGAKAASGGDWFTGSLVDATIR